MTTRAAYINALRKELATVENLYGDPARAALIKVELAHYQAMPDGIIEPAAVPPKARGGATSADRQARVLAALKRERAVIAARGDDPERLALIDAEIAAHEPAAAAKASGKK